jgi:hypothetical protein
MASEGIGVPQIEGVEYLYPVDDSLYLAKASLTILREQDKNAHLMDPVMFGQLTENIKNSGKLESVPLCAIVDNKVEIISGHHRTRAAREAGLDVIVILVYVRGLTRSQIAAKQLAHNNLVGFDDKAMLAEISKLITDIDDKIEAYLPKEMTELPKTEMDSLISPSLDFDWRVVQLVFLPHQHTDYKKLIDLCIANTDSIGVVSMEIFSAFSDVLAKYQKLQDVKSVGSSIAMLIQKARQELDDAEYSEDEEWVTLSSIIGAGAIPKEYADIIKDGIKKLVADGVISEKKKWQALAVWASEYVGADGESG